MAETPTVSYWAISILSSRTAQFAVLTFLVGLLALPDVVALVPVRYTPALLAVVGAINLALRTYTVRPVAFIAPGETKPVDVERMGPPPPPAVTD